MIKVLKEEDKKVSLIIFMLIKYGTIIFWIHGVKGNMLLKLISPVFCFTPLMWLLENFKSYMCPELHLC